jgi:hypothetical protein
MQTPSVLGPTAKGSAYEQVHQTETATHLGLCVGTAVGTRVGVRVGVALPRTTLVRSLV